MACTAAAGRPSGDGRRGIESREQVELARTAIEDKKGEDIVILDVRGLSEITDFFVVVTGSSPPHLKAMAEEIRKAFKQAGMLLRRHAGQPEGGWVVMDCVDVIIHMFLADRRQYYALEALWAQAPRIA